LSLAKPQKPHIALQALVIGAFGIPVALVSGDESACAEAQEWLGDVEVAPTKRGLHTHQAVSLHPTDACDLIRDRTRYAVTRLQELRPFTLEPPYELRVECFNEEQARHRANKYNAELNGKHYVLRTQNPLDLI